MLIAHLADIHLGFKQYGRREREEDIFKAFEYVVENVIKERPDVIIIAGDVFHTPIPSDFNTIINAERVFGKIRESGIPVIGVAGDHDIPRRRGAVGALDYLAEKGYIYLFKLTSQRFKKDIKGVSFGGFSAIPTSNRDYIRRALTIVGKVDVLIMHQSIREAFPYDWQLELKDLPEGIKYVALGHIHKPMSLRKEGTLLVYPGSLEILSISEIIDRDNKSAVLVDLSSDEAQIVGRIKPPIRRQELLVLDDKNYKKKVLSLLSQKIEEGAIFHVKIRGKRAKIVAEEVKEILKRLKPLLIRISIEQYETENLENVGSFTPEDALREVLKDVLKNEHLEYVIDMIKELSEGNEKEAIEISKELFKKL